MGAVYSPQASEFQFVMEVSGNLFPVGSVGA